MWTKLRTFCCTVQRNFRQPHASENLPVEVAASASEVPASTVADPNVPQDVSDEFDPVREIKRLRQDLAHRLLELQSRDGENREEPEKEIFFESRNFESESGKKSDSLTFHIRRARTMLSRLQTETCRNEHGPEKISAMNVNQHAGTEISKSDGVDPMFEDHWEPFVFGKSDSTPPFVDREALEQSPNWCGVVGTGKAATNGSGELQTNSINDLNTAGTDTLRAEKRDPEKFPADFDPLIFANTGLTGLGILVTVMGIGFCRSHGSSFWELGPLLFLTGAVVVAFGLFGRFYGPIRDSLTVADTPRFAE